MSTPTGYGLQNRHCADTTSVRPVQIAQEGEERQAIQYSTPSEGREELKEIKVGQRRCEISTTNAKSQQELLKEDFTESAETEEKTEEFTESAETEEFNESAKTTELTDSKKIKEDFAIKVKEGFKESTEALDVSIESRSNEEMDLKEIFEDLDFGLWKCLKIYRDEISAGPIEEAADDFKMKAMKQSKKGSVNAR